MDPNRFDFIAKTLAAATTRRRSLGGLFGGALGALGLADPDDSSAAKSGKCKQTCAACEDCKKGKCKKKNGKKRCKKGKCVTRPGVPTCTAVTQALNPLTCTCCGTGGDPVSCPMAGTNASCCTGTCDTVGQVCVSRSPGVSCQFGAQCASGVCDSNSLCTAV